MSRTNYNYIEHIHYIRTDRPSTIRFIAFPGKFQRHDSTFGSRIISSRGKQCLGRRHRSTDNKAILCHSLCEQYDWLGSRSSIFRFNQFRLSRGWLRQGKIRGGNATRKCAATWLAGNRRDESNAAANIVVGRVRMKRGKKQQTFDSGYRIAPDESVCAATVYSSVFFPRFLAFLRTDDAFDRCCDYCVVLANYFIFMLVYLFLLFSFRQNRLFCPFLIQIVQSIHPILVYYIFNYVFLMLYIHFIVILYTFLTK